MTLPISPGPAAPVDATAAAIIFLISSSVNCAGKYLAITSPSAFSSAAFSGRFALANSSAASRRFFASRESTVMISSSLSTRASFPATSSVVIAVSTMRIVPDTTLSLLRIASVRSAFNVSLSPMASSSHVRLFFVNHDFRNP